LDIQNYQGHDGHSTQQEICPCQPQNKALQRKSPPGRQVKRAAAKQSTNKGLMKAVQPGAALAAIVGTKPLPRIEITKRLWDYIKEHGLQDAQNKRMINADAKLQPLFGGQEQVSILEPKLMSRMCSKG
jgi:upstream activation factor subunit UAF30